MLSQLESSTLLLWAGLCHKHLHIAWTLGPVWCCSFLPLCMWCWRSLLVLLCYIFRLACCSHWKDFLMLASSSIWNISCRGLVIRDFSSSSSSSSALCCLSYSLSCSSQGTAFLLKYSWLLVVWSWFMALTLTYHFSPTFCCPRCWTLVGTTHVSWRVFISWLRGLYLFLWPVQGVRTSQRSAQTRAVCSTVIFNHFWEVNI